MSDSGNYSLSNLAPNHSAAGLILFALAFLLFVRWGFRGIGFSSAVSASVKV